MSAAVARQVGARSRLCATSPAAEEARGTRSPGEVQVLRGSARDRPGDLALPSQYLDFTRGTRAASFFGAGWSRHIFERAPHLPRHRRTHRTRARAGT